MVLLNIPLPVFNILKFVAVELLVSCLLESAWELIINRRAHARVVRGERVTLAALPKSRTFPCSLTIGRLSGSVAVALSLLTLVGSLASEYAVDSTSVRVRTGNSTAWIYSRNYSTRLVGDPCSDPTLYDDPARAGFRDPIPATTLMANRCYYYDRERREHFVNATFAKVTGFETRACVSMTLLKDSAFLTYA